MIKYNESKISFGFYEIEKMRSCSLSGVAEAIVLTQKVPAELPTRPVLVGQFFHALMEQKVITTAKVQECLEIFRKLVNGNPRLKWMGDPATWKEINDSANRFLSQGHISEKAGEMTSSYSPKLYSKTKRLVGKPDFYTVTDYNANLIEYKSSRILENGEIVAKHLRQLKFYAYLLFQNFELLSVNARLVSLDGYVHSVRYAKEEALEFGAEIESRVEKVLTGLNHGSSLAELARVSSEACRVCSFRPNCTNFLEEQFQHEDFNSFRVIKGRLISVDQTSKFAITLSLSENAKIVLPFKFGFTLPDVSPLLNRNITATYCMGAKGTFEASGRSQIFGVNDEL